MFARISTRTRRSHQRSSILPAGEDFPVGAHLVTPRFGFTHHGIYAGNGRVVHYGSLTHGLPGGPVEEVSLEHFAQGHHVTVKTLPGSPLEGEQVIRRARGRIGENAYRLFSNNCEHFCEWCLYGQQRSYQVEQVLLIPLLKRLALVARARWRPGFALLARE